MNQQYVTIWSRYAGSNWVIERTHTIEYVRLLFGMTTEIGDIIVHNNGREYGVFVESINPNNNL